jgi:hypothetical protein
MLLTCKNNGRNGQLEKELRFVLPNSIVLVFKLIIIVLLLAAAATTTTTTTTAADLALALIVGG